MKTLSVEHKGFLDSPIFSSEILKTIGSLKLNKALGRDGLPTEFYIKKIADLLVDPLSQLFNDILTGGLVPDSWNLTKIVVISKLTILRTLKPFA